MAGSITSTSLSDKLPAIPEYDAIIIGSGIGGLVTVTQLIVKGVKIIVSESYIIPVVVRVILKRKDTHLRLVHQLYSVLTRKAQQIYLLVLY